MVHGSQSLLIVAAEPMFAHGLKSLLGRCFSVETAASLSDAINVVRWKPPRLCLLVLSPTLPDGSMEEAFSQLVARQAETRTVALFRIGDYRHIGSLCRKGALGFIDTSAPVHDLISALERVLVGDVTVHPSVLPHLVEAQRFSSEDPTEPLLTGTQLRTLGLLANGYSSKEIARLTSTSTAAVNHLIERATARLGASHRAHAVARAFRCGLLGVEHE